MKVQILNTDVKVMVRRDDDVKLLLAKTNGIKVGSLDRWLREDSVMLTTATNLQIIKDHFKLNNSVELTEVREMEEIK